MIRSRKTWVLEFVREGPNRNDRFFRLLKNIASDVKTQNTEIYSSGEVLELLRAVLDGEK